MMIQKYSKNIFGTLKILNELKLQLLWTFILGREWRSKQGWFREMISLSSPFLQGHRMCVSEAQDGEPFRKVDIRRPLAASFEAFAS
jgi:hypothetical protein